MKKIICIIVMIFLLSGCTKQQPVVEPPKPSLSVEQLDNYKLQISKVLGKKSWIMDQKLNYKSITLPLKVENTYYADILAKSKDGGYDFTKYLGKDVIEVSANVKYSNGDVAGVGHFLFSQDKIVGAYYTVENYIYSLNEREVFKKVVSWGNVENAQKKKTYKETPFVAASNLIYWGKHNNIPYLFSWAQNKLQILTVDKDQLLINRELSLDGLYLTSMFLKDVDKDKKEELALLVSTSPKWWEKDAKSKLLIYEFDDKLKKKYSVGFENPMWSIDFDGNDIIATSEKSIEMYSIDDNGLKKNYAYNKVGGIIKVDDIDNSGIPRYILRDSSGTDIYVFQRNKDGLEEIWRTYNKKPGFSGVIQVADLNDDKVKEIYLQDKAGNTKKIILQRNGFVMGKDIKSGHKYFTGDFNGDGKYEYFDTYTVSKRKGATTVYRY